MKVHDDAMIHHGTINKNSRLLKGVLSSVTELSEQQEIVASLKSLQDANNAMMKWMQEYKDPEANAPLDSILDYYNSVQEDMEGINVQILQALEESEPLIEKYRR